MIDRQPTVLLVDDDVRTLDLIGAVLQTQSLDVALAKSPDEAKKSLAYAKNIFALHKADAKLTHVIVDSGHDYNKPMREAMFIQRELPLSKSSQARSLFLVMNRFKLHICTSMIASR